MTSLAAVGTFHSIPNMAGFGPGWHPPAEDGRGLASHTIPFGATMGERFESTKGTGGQPSYQERLRTYFGEPPKAFGPRPYSVENYDLPDAYKGENFFLSEIIQRTILATDLFPIYDILPWKQNPGMKINWEVMKYDDHTLDHVPHEGVPRMVMSSSSQHTASMQRWGKAMLLEHGFMETAKGRSNYVHNLVSISNAVLETCCWMAMNALMVVAPYNDGWARPSGSNISIGQLEDIFEDEIANFAVSVKDDNAMERTLDRLSARMTARGVTGANYFVAPKGMSTACANHPSKKYFFLSGDKGGPHAPNTGGFLVRESRAFRDGWQPTPRDPLYREVAIGEFYTMGYMHMSGSSSKRGSKVPFNTEQLNTRIYSEKADAYVEIAIGDAILNSGIYTSDWNITPLGRQFFGQIHSSESRKQIGPFQSWGDWLSEYDPSKAVASGIHALGAGAKAFMDAVVGVASGAAAGLVPDAAAMDDDDDGDDASNDGDGQQATHSGPRALYGVYKGGVPKKAALTLEKARALDEAAEAFVQECVPVEERMMWRAPDKLGEDVLPLLRTGLAMVVVSVTTPKLFSKAAVGKNHTERVKAALAYLRKEFDADSRAVVARMFSCCAAVRLIITNKRKIQLGSRTTYDANVIQEMDAALATVDRVTGAILHAVAAGVEWWTVFTDKPETWIKYEIDVWEAKAAEVEAQVAAKLDGPAKMVAAALSIEGIEAWLATVSCTNGQFVKACLEHDIPCPLGVLLLRPHQTYLMGTGVLCVPGGAIGHTFFKNIDMELSDDGVRKVHFANLTLYATALAMFPKNMCWARNIHSARCVGGAGHTFWKYDELDSTVGGLSDHQQGELTADLVACAVPMNYKPVHGWHLDITGAYNPKLYAPTKPEPLHHPAAHVYSAYWGWNNQSHQAFLPNTFFRDNAAPTANTVCFQGLQFVADRRTGDLTVPITNRGHWGIHVGPGVRAVRHGTSSNMPQFDYTQQTRRFGAPA